MADDGAAGRAGKNTVKGNRSFGSADRSNIIHGDNNTIYLQPDPDDNDGEKGAAGEELSSVSRPSSWMWIAGAAVVALIVLCNIIPDPPEPKSSFPAENGTRPAGSSDAAVLAAALGGLQSCAKAPVLQPQNCPQRVGGWWAGDATNVTWRIHGVPGDGAVIHYNGEEGRFHVLGTAVMTASYETASGPDLKLRVVEFWARVEWTAGKAKLAELRNYDDTPRPAIEKRNPQVPDELALSLVKTAFEECVKTRKSELPPECPDINSGAGSGKVSWKLNGDPSINAKPRFEPSTGLIHVDGNYSVTASYSQLFLGATSQPASGRYDAILSVDDGKPQVLRINKA
ncbi:hypothetical protein [Micromonospora aurantiaca (nom. illeg.)]|uniref:hypothetical protein n=1 Tax=Micromonospora aurantiaca (nom. illeg.) TaxID=47850 RepID=UPI000829109A|nr:hypothetical protein [Micromonospora aurantiaca]SCL36077.1 hypothetical protein GA0070615_2959 [Micromonospora aurantiaca]